MPDLGAVWGGEVARFMPEEATIAAEGMEKRSRPEEGAGEMRNVPDPPRAPGLRRRLCGEGLGLLS